jgi:archaellum component FlaF (FlaF/FlaG flagellin family)
LQEHGIDASATSGEKSQFDVIHDGELVYSKQKEHRFPEPGEVLSLLRA